MSFDSIQFFIFLPIALAVYRIMPSSFRWFVLLLLSYIFYGYTDPSMLLVLIGITLVSYVCARKTFSAYEKVMKKVYTVVPIVISLGALFTFKYFNVFMAGLADTLGIIKINMDTVSHSLAVPLGISIFTLKAVTYAIEVYRENTEPERNIAHFALYMAFFPTVVAGPIDRPQDLIPQIKARKPFAAYDAAYGLKMLALGLFKILAVSDIIAPIVDSVFANGTLTGSFKIANGFTVLVATFLFAVQMYCDFSGICDIATACAALLGFKIKKNYDLPYLATSVKELHGRWNITLNNMLDDYVYQPLGADRTNFKYYRNLVIVYALAGVWYGAGINFLLFGLLHLGMRTVAELTVKYRTQFWDKFGVKQDNRWLRYARRAGVITLTVLSLMLVRVRSLKAVGYFLWKLICGWGQFSIEASLAAMGVSGLTLITVFIAVIVMVLLDRQIASRPVSFEGKLLPERAQSYLVICWAIVIAWFMLLVSGGAQTFQYFVF